MRVRAGGVRAGGVAGALLLAGALTLPGVLAAPAAAAATAPAPYQVEITTGGFTTSDGTAVDTLVLPVGRPVVWHNHTALGFYRIVVDAGRQDAWTNGDRTLAPGATSQPWTVTAGSHPVVASQQPAGSQATMTVTAAAGSPAPSASASAPTAAGGAGGKGRPPAVAPAPSAAGTASPVPTVFPAGPPPAPAIPLPSAGLAGAGAATIGVGPPLVAPSDAPAPFGVGATPNGSALAAADPVRGGSVPATGIGVGRARGMAGAVAAVLLVGLFAALVRVLLAEPAAVDGPARAGRLAS